FVGRAVAETLDGVGHGGFLAVQFGAAEKYLAYAEYDGRMRIAFALDVGVMLAMNGHPLFRDHACGEPQPETEEMHDCWMEVQAAVRLVTMQEQRDAGNRDVSKHQCGDTDLPP